MSRLIDGDRLKKEIHEKDIMGGLNYEWYIDHAESVDAVEVVRCKNCKYRPHLRDAVDEDDAEKLKLGHFNGFDLRFPTEWKCPCQVYDDEYYSWIPKDDWFCADGERREEP